MKKASGVSELFAHSAKITDMMQYTERLNVAAKLVKLGTLKACRGGNKMAIEWRHVTDPMYSHYEVSNTGLVRLGDNIKKAYKTKHGYQSVMLYNHCRYKHFTIHRLVAMAFIKVTEKPLVSTMGI